MNHRKVKASSSKDKSSDRSFLRVRHYFDLVNASMPTFEEGFFGTLYIVDRSQMLTLVLQICLMDVISPLRKMERSHRLPLSVVNRVVIMHKIR
jgi:hypothetical protein